MNEFDVSSLEQLALFSKKVFELDHKVFLLKGDLGAGKTTFVSYFLKENLLEPSENFDELGVMSPTFSLINTYQSKKFSIVHADMYRLKENDFEEEELLDLIEESDFAFIEWPSKLRLEKSLHTLFKSLSLDFQFDSESAIRKVSYKIS